MNYELFIAKKIISGKGNPQKISSPVIRIAVGGMALGLTVMILTIAIVSGFQKEIREKMSGFTGHITISLYDSNSSFEKKPLDLNSPGLAQALQSNKNCAHWQGFATKAAIIKTDSEIEGVMLKGIGKDFDWSFFKRYLMAGQTFTVRDSVKSNEVLISEYTAKRLKLKAGDDVIFYFVQQPPRMRKLKVSGIYASGMEEMDKLYVLCDLAHIQKLNDWKDTEVAGIEVSLTDFAKMDATAKELNEQIGFNMKAETIKEQSPQLFDWLGLQDMNAIIIITLILLVCAINMISALLILILERSGTIGILKSLGASDFSIRKLFLYVAGYLLFTGMVIGNAIGISLCLLQKHFGWFKLNQESYYIPVVPIHMNISDLLMLNGGTFLACILFLIIPTAVISRITPIKAIRFN